MESQQDILKKNWKNYIDIQYFANKSNKINIIIYKEFYYIIIIMNKYFLR